MSEESKKKRDEKRRLFKESLFKILEGLGVFKNKPCPIQTQTRSKGRLHDAEWNAAISAGLTGKHLSKETKQKLREINLGKVASPELCKKLSVLAKARIKAQGGQHPNSIAAMRAGAKIYFSKQENKDYMAGLLEERVNSGKQRVSWTSKLEGKAADLFTAAGLAFTQQFHVKGSHHPYDFHFTGTDLIVEMDGCFYHVCEQHCPLGFCKKKGEPLWRLTQRARDAKSQAHAESRGYRVLRIWEHDLQRAVEMVVQKLHESQGVAA